MQEENQKKKPGYLYGIEMMIAKCKENYDLCSENEIMWIGRLDAAYTQQQDLSKKQIVILQDIYYKIKKVAESRKVAERTRILEGVADDIIMTGYLDGWGRKDQMEIIEALKRRI